MNKGKGLIRSTNRRGAKSGKATPAESRTGRVAEPTVCEGCAAVFSRRTWRKGRAVTDAVLARARWTVCPACEQTKSGEYQGCVLVRGRFALANEATIRQRILNIAAHAAHTQPERRIVSVDRDTEGLEILTTSQKLAHRIAHELKKVFRGRTTYAWSDRDGSLFATWRREDTRD